MTDLERFCFMLEEFGLNYQVGGPRLGVTTRVTLIEGLTKFNIYFEESGRIKR